MLDISIAAVVVVVVVVGLWFTRNVRGASPIDSVERSADAMMKARGIDPFATPELEPPKEDL